MCISLVQSIDSATFVIKLKKEKKISSNTMDRKLKHIEFLYDELKAKDKQIDNLKETNK